MATARFRLRLRTFLLLTKAGGVLLGAICLVLTGIHAFPESREDVARHELDASTDRAVCQGPSRTVASVMGRYHANHRQLGQSNLLR